ncbi:MAG: NADH-quinone oxidoreductase subunit L [Steroidobacteraceae bacterium]
MSHHSQWLAWLVPLVYLLGAAVALPHRRCWDVLNWAAGSALGIALAGDLLRLAPHGPGGGAPPVADAVMTLVAFLGWIIARYSRGNLAGEPGERRFTVALLTTLASVGAVLAASSFAVLILAWICSSLALHPLLTHYRDRPLARLAARKKFITSRLAELCLAGAAALLYLHCHTLDLSALDRVAARGVGSSESLRFAATLLAAAVLLKSAQLPVHGWLIQVMEAPTSVSALLHAGVINLGGYVLIRLAPLVAASPLAEGLLVLVGSSSAVLAGLTMMTTASRKGRLAWSTCSQMGLMAAECGLGLYDLALLHLIGHALYKAHAFLSSGEAVRESTVRRMQPATRTVSGTTALAALSAGALVAGGSAGLWRLGLHTAPVPGIALLVCSLGIATLLWNTAADFRARARNLATAAAGMQLYLLWHLSINHAMQIASMHPLPGLVLFSATCFLGLYLAQWHVLRTAARTPHARLFAWSSAGYFLDEPLNRLASFHWPLHGVRRGSAGFGQWRTQREGGTA